MRQRSASGISWLAQDVPLAYGHNIIASQRRAGRYVSRILRGASPAELPAERPDEWKLTVNLQAASRLGLSLPSSLVGRADEVID